MSTEKNNSSDFFIRTLESLMKADGVTKAQLARELSVSNAHVANWLKGQIPNAENLLIISRRFGVTIEQLITGVKAQAGASTTAREPAGLKQARQAAEKLARQLGDAETTARQLRAFLG